jgi:hypothetical protein
MKKIKKIKKTLIKEIVKAIKHHQIIRDIKNQKYIEKNYELDPIFLKYKKD